MSFHGFGNRTRVELRSSPLPLIVLTPLYGLVHWAVMMADVPVALRLFFLALNAWALAAQLRAWAFPSLTLEHDDLVLAPDGRLWLERRTGETTSLGLERVAWLSSRLLVVSLRLAGEKRRRWLVLVDPAGDRRDLRRLRVHLQWGRVRRVPGSLGRLVPTGPVSRHQDRVTGLLRRQ